jgi:hypothetical protein
VGSTGMVKSHNKNKLCVIRLLVRCTLYIVGYDNCMQNRSYDSCRVCHSSGFEGETHQSSQSHLEQPERGMKQHKGWLAAGASGAPSRGPDILKLHI